MKEKGKGAGILNKLSKERQRRGEEMSEKIHKEQVP
jgi:hypothetical protein